MSKIIRNFLARRVLSRTAILLIDILMIVFSCLLTYFLWYGFDGLTPDVRRDGTTLFLLLVFFNFISFVSLRTFSGILRFSSFTDLLRIIYALALGYGATMVAVIILKSYRDTFNVTLQIFISVFFLNTFLM